LERGCEESENMVNKTLVEDRLDGASNFSSWKSRIQITLEEEDLLWTIQKAFLEIATDEEKEERKEDDVKEKKIIKLLH
jgi:predicted oxidoreductase (fatty acid repression mutant protein)